RGVDDGRQTGAIFNTLPQVNPSRTMGTAVGDAANRGLYWLGGKASLFAKDEFGKASRVLVAPRKPLLKRVGMVNLNDVEEGAQGVSAYLDQMAYIKGGMDQAARDHLYGRWAATSTDVERKAIVDELERQGIEMVLRKHGIQHGEMLDRVKEALQGKRADAWSRMSDPARYTTVMDPETGRRLDKQVFQYEDGDGAATKVAMPMDPTELPNWRPLTNLVDLDHQLATHADLYREMDKAHALGLRKARQVEEAYNLVGETLNSLWKPAALLSLRWPARVVADESFRVMLAMGVWPHVSAWGEGARNVLYNTGFVKPYEWVKGRKIATGSLADDTLRTEYDAFDPFDPRSAKNPTGAVPVDAADFGSIDPTRYDKLQQHTAERRDWMRKAQMGPKPRWAQRFEDRTAAAEGSDSRGFFFDPVTHRARNKGFAVSVYPGRLRTFEKKPTAADLHWWMDRNSDLLSIPSNQVATWLDKGTGRWHLDVVRTMARREDAMQLASRANANEFFDIGDGFTRYLADEDPHGYLNGPLLNPAADPAPATTGEPVQTRMERKALGFGKKKWRSLDGKVVEGEGVYGLSKDDPNIFYSAHSSKGAFQQLYGGYTKGLGVARAKRSGNGARVFHPEDDPKAWSEAQSWYVNRHFRNSPIWLRMLNGDSDEKILSWLKSSESR
ncbi:MAG TPA: hypothetical protein VFH56_05565, partial [Acidimicrobiales bacterium]|nr:hypothetical protein [Acidimicrobiales bacterium]